jgi:hypothetical protein
MGSGRLRLFQLLNQLHRNVPVPRPLPAGTLVEAFPLHRTLPLQLDNFARYHIYRHDCFRHSLFWRSLDLPLGFFYRHRVARLVAFRQEPDRTQSIAAHSFLFLFFCPDGGTMPTHGTFYRHCLSNAQILMPQLCLLYQAQHFVPESCQATP